MPDKCGFQVAEQKAANNTRLEELASQKADLESAIEADENELKAVEAEVAAQQQLQVRGRGMSQV